MKLVRRHPAAPQDGPNPQRLGIGDVVRLRSGGPDMIVVDIDSDPCSERLRRIEGEEYATVTVSWPVGSDINEWRVPARCVDLIVKAS